MHKKPARQQAAFHWVPIQDRRGPTGEPLPPHPPEYRRPLFWLLRKGNDLWFINDTEETLQKVSAESAGFTNTDDDELLLKDDDGLTYLHVSPGEAVKIEEYDPWTDSDFVLQVRVHLLRANGVAMRFIGPMNKGGLKGECVLLWDDGSIGKQVSLPKEKR